MQQPLDVLKQYFGYSTFRELQEEVIESVLLGRDTFALMPTAGGKSLCFQVPALAKPGICLVVSPLIALMKDQVLNLQKRGIKALAIIGNLSTSEISDLLDNALYGNYKFLYLAPERLQQPWILERITALPINLVAIDEAHCVSQWGHDFRPAYLNINSLRTHLPNVPFLALTASATPRVKEDVIQQLQMKNVAEFRSSFLRKNLAFKVIETQDKFYQLQRILSQHTSSAIVYVRNRKSCIEVSNYLNSVGIRASYFHGGLSFSEKEKNMSLWLEDKIQVMVATNAFGIGIDKPNVGCVVHIQLPESLESYYQEAGRAGRNGAYSEAVLLLSSQDVQAAERQFLSVLPDKEFLKEVYIKLFNYFQIAYGELPEEEFSFSFTHFCEKYKLPPLKTYNAMTFLDRQSIITLSQEFSNKVKLQFITEGKEVIRYMSLNPKDEEIITTILRSYPGIFDTEIAINTLHIAKKSGSSEEKVFNLFEKLQKLEIVRYKSQKNDSCVIFNEVREDERTINRIAKFLKTQNDIKKEQLEAVIHYATDKKICKSAMLLTYFGEPSVENCGVCSVCASENGVGVNYEEITNKILEILKLNPHSSRELESKLKLSQVQLLEGIQRLLDSGKIGINASNQYFLIKEK